MIRWITALVVAVFVVVPAAGSTQDELGASPVVEDVSEEPADPNQLPVRLDLSLDAELDTPFFAHDEFGFDAATFTAIVDDASHWIADVARYVARLPRGTPADVFARVIPWLVFVCLLFAALWTERRAKRGFKTLAQSVTTARSTDNERLDTIRRVFIESAGVIVVPVAAWMLSYVPVQGLFESAPWTVALSRGLGIFLIYRVVYAVAGAVFGEDLFEFPRDAADRLLKVTVSSARAITLFAIAADSVTTISYREDVHALSMTLLRLSITLLSLRVLAATGHIARLLPAEGNPSYLRFRSVFVRYLPHFLAFSVLLLALWTLGFNRAATTVLVRSYSIIGLLVTGALALRWFDRYSQRPHPDTLVRALIDQVDSFARFCINLAFAAAILSLLGLLDPLRVVLDNVGVSVGTSNLTALNIIRGLCIIGGAVLVSRVTRVLLDWWLYPRFEVEVGAAHATSTAVHYVVIALALGLALITLGIDLAALAVFAGALGVGLGFGLQDFARNLISGLVLLFGRVIEKGDLVTVNDTYIGNVEEIGGRMVRIRTRDNTDMVIPASEVVGSALVNWTHSDPLVRLHIPVGVSYDSDVREVREALLAAAESYPQAKSDPAPDVWFIEFGDNSINFELLIWVDAVAVDPRAARGRIMFHVWDALLERDIEIPFPQRDLHIRTVDPGVWDRD